MIYEGMELIMVSLSFSFSLYVSLSLSLSLPPSLSLSLHLFRSLSLSLSTSSQGGRYHLTEKLAPHPFSRVCSDSSQDYIFKHNHQSGLELYTYTVLFEPNKIVARFCYIVTVFVTNNNTLLQIIIHCYRFCYK